MDEFRNPLVDVPRDLHELMPPYLDLAKKVGRANAEQTTTLHPLPWTKDASDWIVSAVVSDFDTAVRHEMPELPDVVLEAMGRHLVASFADRLEEIWKARSGNQVGRA